MVSPVIGHGTVPGDEQLQWLLRFSYVPAGLDVLFTRAEDLRDSLILVEKATNKLNQVWEIYNSKADTDLDIAVNIPDVTNPEDFADPNEDFDPQYYTNVGAEADITALEDLRDDLQAIADALGLISGGDLSLQEQIQRVVDSLADVSDEESLIKWQNNFDPDASDGFDADSSSGTFLQVTDPELIEGLPVGNIIRDAIGATQASNERARQDLRSALFTFEEFVKSAGSLMERISRMIEKLATGASGR